MTRTMASAVERLGRLLDRLGARQPEWSKVFPPDLADVLRSQAGEEPRHPDYRAMSPGEMHHALGMDGHAWAEAFRQLNPSLPLAPEAMVGWFCNAIMAGWDAAHGNPPLNGDHAQWLLDQAGQRKEDEMQQGDKVTMAVDGHGFTADDIKAALNPSRGANVYRDFHGERAGQTYRERWQEVQAQRQQAASEPSARWQGGDRKTLDDALVRLDGLIVAEACQVEVATAACVRLYGAVEIENGIGAEASENRRLPGVVEMIHLRLDELERLQRRSLGLLHRIAEA